MSAASAYSVSCDCWKFVSHRQRRGAGVHADAARRSLGRVAQRRLGHQAARIDRPERDAGADGRVDGGVQLRLVVHAVQPQAAGEVDQRFLLVELAQHLGGGLQRGQLAVGIEDVELAVVLAEGGAGVGGAGVVDGVVEALVFADDHGFDDAQQPVAIVGEILQHLHRARLVNVMMATRSAGVICVRMNLRAASKARNWSAGGMAVISKYSASSRRSLIADVSGRFGRNLRLRQACGMRRGFGGLRCRRRRIGRSSGSFWIFEEADGLRHAVFGDGEIFRGQAFDRLAVLVFDRDRLDHQLRVGLKRGCRASGRGAFWPICCAPAASINERVETRKSDRIVQNLKRSVVCTLRMALAGFGRPNCALLTVVFQLVERDVVERVGGVDPQVEVEAVAQRKVRPSEAFKENCDGPVIEFLPALPHWPGAAARRPPDSGRSPRRGVNRRARVIRPDAVR